MTSAACNTARKLLNVTFDPDIPEQLASYGHDDDGTAASKQFLIREGLLLRPLGGALSQFRAGHGRRRQQPRLRLEPPADRPHGQPQHRARRSDRWSN